MSGKAQGVHPLLALIAENSHWFFMALIPCPSCKSRVSKQAASCPHCGHQFKASGSINLSDPVHVIGVILAIIIAIGAVMAFLP